MIILFVTSWLRLFPRRRFGAERTMPCARLCGASASRWVHSPPSSIGGVGPTGPAIMAPSPAASNKQRLIAELTSFFGALALILASIGVYGVIAYNAGSRTSEIGVRMALGADRSDVFGLILRGALVLISFGLLLGIPLALAAGRFLGSQLYGVNQNDPAIMALAILVLGSSAVTAALIPALRASSISPSQALRAD